MFFLPSPSVMFPGRFLYFLVENLQQQPNTNTTELSVSAAGTHWACVSVSSKWKSGTLDTWENWCSLHWPMPFYFDWNGDFWFTREDTLSTFISSLLDCLYTMVTPLWSRMITYGHTIVITYDYFKDTSLWLHVITYGATIVITYDYIMVTPLWSHKKIAYFKGELEEKNLSGFQKQFQWDILSWT